METVFTNMRNQLNTNLSAASQNVSPLSATQATREPGQNQLPQARIGLGSDEGELIVLLKKYLEIVGLVFFVWLLGKSDRESCFVLHLIINDVDLWQRLSTSPF